MGRFCVCSAPRFVLLALALAVLLRVGLLSPVVPLVVAPLIPSVPSSCRRSLAFSLWAALALYECALGAHRMSMC